MFHKSMGKLEKMQAIGDIISYFSPFNCRSKKSTKIQLGDNIWYFSPCVLFFPYRSCNNCSTSQMVNWREHIAIGKSNNIFPAGHNLFCDSICVFQLGDNIWHFFPLCLYFFPLGRAIIVLLSQMVYSGENIARGKSNHTMFHKIMGNSEKNAGNRGHNIIILPYYFNCHDKKSIKIQLVENIWYFFP